MISSLKYFRRFDDPTYSRPLARVGLRCGDGYSHVDVADQANKVYVADGAYHIHRANVRKPYLCELNRCRHERKCISDVMSSSMKDYLLIWSECLCHKVLAVHFDIILELVDNVEAGRVSHNGEHEICAQEVGSGICNWAVSRKSSLAMR
jgi:hypothetical protein